MAVSSLMVPLGTPAHDFELPSADGTTVKLADLDGRALLMMFLCNHCPYVRHVERQLGAVVAEYARRGVSAVGICSNDLEAYPVDGPAGMSEQAPRGGAGGPAGARAAPSQHGLQPQVAAGQPAELADRLRLSGRPAYCPI